MSSSNHKKGGCLRLLLWTAVMAVVPCLVFIFLLSWQAERRWEKAQAMIEAEGLSLDWRKMLPPRLPDAVNYAAMDPFWGATNSEGYEDEGGRAATNRRILDDLRDGLDRVYVSSRGVERATPPDWGKALEALRETGFLNAEPVAGKEAEAVFHALEERKGLLKQIVAPALDHIEAEFVPGLYGEDMSKPLQTIKTSVAQITGFCRLAYFHGLAAATAGRPAAALADLRASILLGKAHLREPSIINRLVGAALLGQSQEILWNLARLRALDESQLEKLQRLLGSIDLEKDFLHHMDIQMLGDLEAIAELAEHREQRRHFFNSPFIDIPEGVASLSPLLPEWFFITNQAALVEIEMEYIFKPFRTHGWAGMIEQRKALETLLTTGERWKNLDLCFAQLMVPVVIDLSLTELARSEVRLRQSLIVCGLERFYLNHGNYPATLDELVPEFLASVPLDPMDHQPIRYRPSASGRYRLWCVGVDLKDAGGESNPDPKVRVRPIDYQGDWVWQYEPVKSSEP